MWIVCQIGAREHYAIARALIHKGALRMMVTDCWVNPGGIIDLLPVAKKLRDRHHAQLHEANVKAPNWTLLMFELRQRIKKRRGWSVNMARNILFQRLAVRILSKSKFLGNSHVIFSYSYAARDLFEHARKRGWKTVLGQIDPGPEEERIVAAEHLRYPQLGSRWKPAPAEYWDLWREEINLADTIVVNSEWSKQCLLKEGIPKEKLKIIPLVYDGAKNISLLESGGGSQPITGDGHQIYKVLFLGQINLRKGIGRLLEAMRLLKDDAIHLTLAGPCEIDESAWHDLPNVKWVGSVPRSQVGQLYEEAEVFILPTLSDGYAITQLEALSRGLPVIASAHCGSAVDHGVNGWILADIEPQTIAEAIRLSRRQPLKPVVSEATFSMDDLGDALIDLV
ncbi:glycosyl transferase [Oceaniferula spumae]|uniref:Glycosyl transferase n=1 Tax=Oceaniferula spumae TaxID=2979115 RepID=A0AAT9FNW0_9BACT